MTNYKRINAFISVQSNIRSLGSAERNKSVIINVTQVSPYMASYQILERKKSPDILSTNFLKLKKKKALEKILAFLLPKETGSEDGRVGDKSATDICTKEKESKGKPTPEACSGQQETHHISDEVFAPSLSSSENWSHEIPVLLTLRYGNANHS